MRKTIRKWFWTWDYEKEEKWLNEMAAKGLALVGVGFAKYEFEESLPGEYAVHFELLQHPKSHPESENYIRFIEETGAEQVGNYLRWVYFRKKSADGPFALFSDNASRITHLKRIIGLMLPIGILNLVIGLQNVGLFFWHHFDGNLIGIINLALGVLCCLGALPIRKKIKALKKEQQIFE